jgi:hypothetical protein
LLIGLVLSWWVFAVLLSLFTAACAPSRGNPVMLHLGMAMAGSGVVTVPLLWARRAYRRGYAWHSWVLVSALCAVAAVDAAVSVHVAGCAFVF